MRKVGPDAANAVTAFLHQHIALSMFPLSNLQNFGMAGGHPRACSFFVAERDGTITDVMTVTDEGMVFPQCPSGDWAALAQALNGRRVKGILGEAGQVAALRAALGRTDAAGLDAVTPFYELALSDLRLPDVAGLELRALRTVPVDTLHMWRASFAAETLAVPAEDAVVQAEQDIARYIKADSHRVLFADGQPVAMTGFNARLPQIVQIGGVYTPPGLRGRGYARAAVAMHLAEARKDGVERAVLFAANPSAEKAYRALGFRQTGSFAIAVWEALEHG